MLPWRARWKSGEGMQQVRIRAEDLQQRIDGVDRYFGADILHQLCLAAVVAGCGGLIFRQQCFDQSLCGQLCGGIGELLLNQTKCVIEQEFHEAVAGVECLQSGRMPVELATLLHEQGQLPLWNLCLLLQQLDGLLDKLLLFGGQLSLVCKFSAGPAKRCQQSLCVFACDEVEHGLGVVLHEWNVKCCHQSRCRQQCFIVGDQQGLQSVAIALSECPGEGRVSDVGLLQQPVFKLIQNQQDSGASAATDGFQGVCDLLNCGGLSGGGITMGDEVLFVQGGQKSEFCQFLRGIDVDGDDVV